VYELTLRGLDHTLRVARLAYPREACGVLIGAARGHVTRLSVMATTAEENTSLSFVIRDRAIQTIAQSLDKSSAVRGCFHSHVLGPARPSKRDCTAHKSRGDLWLIYSLRFLDLRLFTWDGARFSRTRFRVVPAP
jgi:proteasome lid subunit RPN8/RPN11